MGSKRPRIAFWGNFGTGNWGNECTLQAIVHNARARVPDAELSCICSEPDDTEKRHGLPSLPISHVRQQGSIPPGGRRLPKPLRVLRRASREVGEWVRTIAAARKLDAVVMTGTGMLTDDGEGVFGLPYDMFKWSVATRACGGKVKFVSVGVEPIESPIARFFIVTALRLADYRSYRDKQSREHLQRVGFSSERDRVFPDLAFSLPKAAAPKSENGSHRRPKVAVGVYNFRARGARGGDDAIAYQDYLDKLASFILWLLERDYAVRVLIGDLTYDEPVVGDLREVLRGKGIARFADRLADQPAASVDEVMQQIAEVDVVVASRFHNVLLALLLGKPVVSIAYNEKNDALMEQMGLSRYCQAIEKLDFGRLVEQFSDIVASGEALRSTITGKGMANRADLEAQYDTVFASAGGGKTSPRSATHDEDRRSGAAAP